MTKEKIKGWAVIWNKKAELYGAKENEIIYVEPEPDMNGKRYKYKGIYIDVLAIFPTKNWAECYRDKNKEWKVIRCEIII